MASSSTNVVSLNGMDVSDLELEVVDLGEPYGGLAFDRETARPFGTAGAWMAAEARTQPRVIALEFTLLGTTSNRRSRLDAVRRHLKGVVEVVIEDETTRAIYGRIEQAPGRPRYPEVAMIDSSAELSLTLEVTCYNPLWQDLQPEVVAFDSARAETPLGTAPSSPTIYVRGPATNPEVVYRGITGGELESMDFNGLTLASDEELEIDTANATVTKYDSGVTSDSIADLDAGWFFHLDPGDGDRDGSIWPTLEVDAGSATVHYRRMWE